MLSPPSSASSSDDASTFDSDTHLLGDFTASNKRSRDTRDDARPASGEKQKKRKKAADKAENSGTSRFTNVNEPRPKKKKKGKSVEKEAVPQPREEENDDDIYANAEASTAALLNAIVAAVSSTQPPLDNPLPAFVPPPQQAAPPVPGLIPQPPFPFPLPFGQFPPGAPLLPPGGFPSLNDLQFASNDEILRALQTGDLSKFTGGIRPGVIDPTMQGFAPPSGFMVPPIPIPVAQLPVPTPATMNVPTNTIGRPVAVPLASSDSQKHDSHATILATKWLTAKQLTEMVETEGLVYKKGKFSATEEAQLKDAIEAYRKSREISEAGLQAIIFPSNDKNRDNEFWTSITRAIPQRPIIAVYHHVRRKWHPMKRQGEWHADEDAKLKAAVADLGQAWEKVAAHVGRMASDCRDRYRNHIQGRESRVMGPWSKEEEAELTRIVTDMTIKQGRNVDNEVFWSRVSELMGGRRSRQQCRIKWTDSLSKLVKNDGAKPRWNQQDAYILVHKIDSLGVNDDTEIDWKTLPDPDWNLWSAHVLQRRWYTMKRSVKGYEEMSHQDIVDILRVKKSLTPEAGSPEAQAGEESQKPPSKKRKERKITSANEIREDAQASGSATPGMPAPSSSAGSE